MRFEDINGQYSRAKVFGGWIVRSLEPVAHLHPEMGMDCFGWYQESLVFVPDPNHEWDADDEY